MSNPDHRLPAVVNGCGYLAIVLLIALPLAVVLVRLGAWQPGLLLYALAMLGSTLLLILFVALALLPRFAARRGLLLRRALPALPGVLLLSQLIAAGGDTPRIHDITTDTTDPPRFAVGQAERGPQANSLDIKPATIALQREAYPDLAPIDSSLSPVEAFTRAQEVAASLDWQVYHRDAEDGVIEAVDTTPIMGFKDDVVIRVRPKGNGSRIDLRSVSRVGEGDMGANAARIRAFAQAFPGDN